MKLATVQWDKWDKPNHYVILGKCGWTMWKGIFTVALCEGILYCHYNLKYICLETVDRLIYFLSSCVLPSMCLLYTDDITMSHDDESSHYHAVNDSPTSPVHSISVSQHSSSLQPCQPVAEATQSGHPWQPSCEVTGSEHLSNSPVSRRKSDAGNTQLCHLLCGDFHLLGNALWHCVKRETEDHGLHGSAELL